MKDEIKEILDKLKDKNNYISHSMILLSIKETTAILDYITNLQQENERLKEAQKNFEKQFIKEMDYKSRIEKAVEYLKEVKEQDFIWTPIFEKELLNILNGRSDE